MRKCMEDYETYKRSHHVDGRKREKRTIAICMRLNSEGSPNGIFRVAVDRPERIRIPFHINKLLNLDSFQTLKAELLVEPGEIVFQGCLSCNGK